MNGSTSSKTNSKAYPPRDDSTSPRTNIVTMDHLQEDGTDQQSSNGDGSPSQTAGPANNSDKLNQLLDIVSEDVLITPARTKECQKIPWKLFIEELSSFGDDDSKRAALERIKNRTVVVHKDQAEEVPKVVHRIYQIEDTLLEKTLRRCPPPDVLETLAEISPTYKASKEMYDLIECMRLVDDEWTEIRRKLYRTTVLNIYNLTETEMKTVFCIRHGWREDTLLQIAARREPPMIVIREFLKQCRESIAIVDTKLYDWIPMIYAVAYSASTDVIQALIPTWDDFQNFRTLQEFNYLEEVDIYDRTPFHWAVFYDSKIETINSLIESIDALEGRASEVLQKKDRSKQRPYELAMSVGTSLEIIEALSPNDGLENYHSIEINMVRSFVYKDANKKWKSKVKKENDKGSDDGVLGDGENETSATASQEEEDEREAAYIGMKRYDVSKKLFPYLAATLEDKKHLQRILSEKSCHTMPTAVLMSDLYAILWIIVSFRHTSLTYLSLVDGETASADIVAWLVILFLGGCYLGCRAIAQSLIEGLEWFLNMWHLIDLATILLVFWCGILMAMNKINDSFVTLSVFGTAAIWTSFLFFLKNTSLRFAIFVSGLTRIVWDLFPFIVVSLLVLVSFGEMYMLDRVAAGQCNGAEASEFCSVDGGLFTIYTFIVSQFEMQDYADTRMGTAISIVFGFLVAIVLLNVIIAIVLNSWEKASDEGREAFWLYRLWFLHAVKNYEEYLPWHDGGEFQSVVKINEFLDRCLEKIMIKLWPRPEGFWGGFDTSIQRLYSPRYGSLSWQYNYDRRLEKNPIKALILKCKVAFCAVVGSIFVLLWCVLGFFTFGVLWPFPIRRFFVAQSLLSEKTEMEEVQDDVRDVLELLSRPTFLRRSIAAVRRDGNGRSPRGRP